MEKYTILFLFIFFPVAYSVILKTYSYCCYLFWKYGKIGEYYDKFLYKHFKEGKRIWKNNPSEKELKKIIKKNNSIEKQEQAIDTAYLREYCLFMRRLKSKEEIDYYYPKDRPRRERFDLFMLLSKTNIIITIILSIFVIVCVILNILPYKILREIVIAKAVIVDGFCILRCVPYGGLRRKNYVQHVWRG